MICPYCKKAIDDTNANQFCPECGQELKDVYDSNISDKYWKDIESDNLKSNKERLDRETVFVSEQNLRRRKKVAITIFLVAMAALFLYIVNTINRNNQAKLPSYYSSMTGNTYSDHKGSMYLMGSSVERIEVEIIDEDTLSYRSGTWIAKQRENSLETNWVEDNVNDPTTYDYNLTIELTGKVYITFNGMSYPVNIEDGKVRSIDFY